jgi:putative thioredoxin
MTSSTHAADVTATSFQREVIDRSRERPVLVDFWASWCGPCQVLMPMLAKLADEYAGKFFLAKVNTDQEQQLATQHGVRSLPTVKLFRDGAVVDEFLGAQPEPVIRALLDRHVPRESDGLIARAAEALESGRLDEAASLLERAVEIDPDSDRVKLARARVLTTLGRLQEAAAALDSASFDARQSDEAKAIHARLAYETLAQDAPAREALEQRAADDPADCRTREQLAARLVLDDEHEAAMEQLLEIVRRDRGYGNDAGRRHLLALFELLGPGDERVKRYRGKLATALN